MQTVGDILKVKGSDVVTVDRNRKVSEALALLKEQGIGAIVVVEDDNRVAGIFSERDFVRIAVEHQDAGLGLSLHQVMTTQVLCVGLTQSVDECMSLMTEKRFRHLPVMEDEVLCGLVSIGDLVKSAISEKEFLIQQLTHYIKS